MFETFAISRIRGAIIDELRALDWVPRSVRSRAREIERAIGQFEAQHHRAPTDEEIARKLELTGDELEESLDEISRSSIVALDELWTMSSTGDQISLIDTIEDHDSVDPQRNLTEAELREAIAKSIANLPEREKIVISLYYYEGLTLNEIGQVLGVTESRACQLHTKAVLQLRAKMSDLSV